MVILTFSEQYICEKVLSEKELVRQILLLKKQGKKIGLCDGSFDLLHPGHMTHLSSAKKLCDFLVVAVASDHFSHVRKGLGRPIFSAAMRAFAVAQLSVVDFVFINESTEMIRQFIKAISLDYYIRGPDYAERKNLELEETEKMMAHLGGKVVYTQDEKLSTTDIIRYIQNQVQ